MQSLAIFDCYVSHDWVILSEKVSRKMAERRKFAVLRGRKEGKSIYIK
jgi:hypothetical protein